MCVCSAETVAALQAFRKRHAEAQRINNHLKATQPQINIAHYKDVLKNQSVVEQAEKILKDFKPVTYEVSEHVKAIEAFEAKAVSLEAFTLLGAGTCDFSVDTMMSMCAIGLHG